MPKSIAGRIKLNTFADIIRGDDTAVTEVPPEDLYDFKDHSLIVNACRRPSSSVTRTRSGIMLPSEEC